MDNYVYICVPINKNFESKGKSAHANTAFFIENNINKVSSEGWEFVNTVVMSSSRSPGCLGLLGQIHKDIVNINVLVFKKRSNVSSVNTLTNSLRYYTMIPICYHSLI